MENQLLVEKNLKLEMDMLLYGWLSKLWSLFGTQKIRCRITIGIQKGTIILATTYIEGCRMISKIDRLRVWGLGLNVWGFRFRV